MKNTTEEIIYYTRDFKNNFSLRPLLNFWEKESANSKTIETAYKYIKEELDKFPELTKVITDFSLVDKHRKLIEEMLDICFSPADKKYGNFAAVYMDRLESFYETPGFKKLGLFKNQMNPDCFNSNCCLSPEGRIIASYSRVLSGFYGFNVSYEYPIIYSNIDEKTGLERHYQIRMFGWFYDIKARDNIDPLSESEKKKLFENLDDPQILTDIVSNKKFEREGFLIFNAIEITDQETISSLKFDLIGKESLTTVAKFEHLQNKLRALLRKPDIELGIIALPSGKKDFDSAMKMGNSIMLKDSFVRQGLINECKIYSEVIENRETRLIYDVKDYVCSSEIEKELLSSGIRNLLIAPLIYKDEIIGILELASSIPGDLNKINSMKLNEVIPLFSAYIESSLDDMNKSIQSVIRENCTAIHPTVDWKFRKAAIKFLEDTRNGKESEMDEIVFEKVNPFYGSSDVKDSSTHRNAAIQSDLIENLKMLNEIFSRASSGSPVPILEEMSFRISNLIDMLRRGLNSNIENSVVNFIRDEVETNFDYIRSLNPDINDLINRYEEKLDPALGIISGKRKEFESSIAMINEKISSELMVRQELAQKIYPHYFEKYKTDGVEYNMYAGSSLVEGENFNVMHLKGLRLWQLETMCIIAKKCNDLKIKLRVPLDLTHLIFVQNSPVSIKFFYDEKKFDVSGSYDIRFEIVKKRIDKAEIKGSKERLAAQGKIAIVYSMESEAEEFRKYIEFLRTKKYIQGPVENIELEDMQGVQGMRALRISVNCDSSN